MAQSKENVRNSVAKTAMAVAESAAGESSVAVTPAVLDILDSSAVAATPVSGLPRRDIVAQDSALLRMPNEVKQRIYKYAVKVDEPIYPTQVVDKANKFLWSKSQLVPKNPHAAVSKIVSAVPQLAVVQLSKTCKQVYADVALTHLFYQVNEFDLRDMSDREIITYLIAITNERKNHIKHIHVPWGFRYRPLGDEIFNLLADLKGLNKLELYIGVDFVNKLNFVPEEVRHFEYCLHAIDGLDHLKLHAPQPRSASMAPNGVLICNSNTATLQARLDSHMRLEVQRGTVDRQLLRKTEELANLHIYGEGRLSKDKKPGLVSSRTRAALRSLANVDGNGIIPQRITPRYDLNGDLAWMVLEVKKSRETFLADGSPDSLEFLVEMAPSLHSKLTEHVETWEDVSVLNLADARWRILFFYQSKKNSGAYGRNEILDMWKLRGDRDTRPTKCMIAAIEALNAKEAKNEARKTAHAAKLEKSRLARESSLARENAKAEAKARMASNKRGKAVKGVAKEGMMKDRSATDTNPPTTKASV